MKKLKAASVLILLIVFSVSAFFAHRASKLEFDYNFESYFPIDDDAPKFFYEFREKFGSDNDFVFIALENKKGIFQKEFLYKVKELSDSLALLPHVESVQSPVNMKSAVVSEMGLFEIPFIHIDQPELYSNDSLRIFQTEWLVNSFFSGDGKAINVVVKNTSMLAKQKSDTLLFNIENLINKQEFDKFHIAGRIHAQHYFLKKMQYEIFLFFGVSLVLVIIFLFFTFRSAWGISIPAITVFAAIIWLFGIMYITGKPLDLMSSLLPTIIFVVGMSDVVHLISKYLDEIRKGKEKLESLKISIKEIGFATILTSFTTAIGFLSLLTSGIIPIRQFGLYSAIGVCIAFVAAYLILPPLLLLMKKPDSYQIPQKSWDRNLHFIFSKTIRYRKYILIFSAIIFLVSTAGVYKIKVNNFLLEDLSDNDEFKKEYLYFENKFTGARPFEMAFWLKDSNKSILDFDVLKQLEKTEIYLKNEYGVGFLISPLTFVKSANQAANGGFGSEYKIPESEKKLSEVKKILKRISKRDEMKMLISDDMRSARISGKMPDYGGFNIKIKNRELDSFLRENTDVALIDYRITGTASLIDKNNELLAQNMLQGLFLAIFIIAVILGSAYRSFKIVLIAIIVNILPLVIIGGIMGFFGIDLKISTSVVFTIAFGIAVDDSIHFLSRMKLEMRKGKSFLYAMKRTYISTGKALVLTTIILSGGFLTLILSAFASSFYIGLLISFSLVFALAADMLLLPALMIVFYAEKNQ